ncbi:hypothetical protein VTO73DRAFT_5008 [Trametes versicolor]
MALRVRRAQFVSIVFAGSRSEQACPGPSSLRDSRSAAVPAEPTLRTAPTRSSCAWAAPAGTRTRPKLGPSPEARAPRAVGQCQWRALSQLVFGISGLDDGEGDAGGERPPNVDGVSQAGAGRGARRAKGCRVAVAPLSLYNASARHEIVTVKRVNLVISCNAHRTDSTPSSRHDIRSSIAEAYAHASYACATKKTLSGRVLQSYSLTACAEDVPSYHATEQLALKQAAQPDGRFSMDAISTELSLRWKAMGAEAKEPDEQAAHDAKKVHAALHPNYRYTRVSKKYMAQILAQQEATEEETEEHFRTVQGFFEVYP